MSQAFVADWHLTSSMTPEQVAVEDAVLQTFMDRLIEATAPNGANFHNSLYCLAASITERGMYSKTVARSPYLRPAPVSTINPAEVDITERMAALPV